MDMTIECYAGDGVQSQRTGETIRVIDVETGETAHGVISAYAGDGLLDVAGTDYWVRIVDCWE